MNNIGELYEAIFIGTVVANFLLNSSRILNVIEICKECTECYLIEEEEVVKLLGFVQE